VIGTTAEAARIVEQRRIDTVFLALPLEAHRAMLSVLKDVGKTVADVRVVPDLLQHITFRAAVEDLDGLPVVHLTQTPLTGWMSLTKRSLDIAISLAALVSSPLSSGSSPLAIRLEDGGPVFYGQTRMGLDGRPFEIRKFRSMRVGAEDGSGPVWAGPEDARCTRVGRVLRRTSLDELPQLRNVLRGEMSLVGPRPERPEFVREFKEKYPQYMVRHRVRAGMTGWAQVHWLAREHEPLQADRVRPLLHRELVAVTRLEDPLADDQARLPAPERVLRSRAIGRSDHRADPGAVLRVPEMIDSMTR
jgi:lipopolysaccharide/colanic/teichoic acid biosynthesis glycosyltransferase